MNVTSAQDDSPRAYRETNRAGRIEIGLLDEATNEIRSAANDLSDIAHTLRDHLDLTLGHNPQPGGVNGGKTPESPVRADQLRASIGNLRHVIAALREQVDRARQI